MENITPPCPWKKDDLIVCCRTGALATVLGPAMVKSRPHIMLQLEGQSRPVPFVPLPSLFRRFYVMEKRPLTVGTSFTPPPPVPTKDMVPTLFADDGVRDVVSLRHHGLVRGMVLDGTDTISGFGADGQLILRRLADKASYPADPTKSYTVTHFSAPSAPVELEAAVVGVETSMYRPKRVREADLPSFTTPVATDGRYSITGGGRDPPLGLQRVPCCCSTVAPPQVVPLANLSNVLFCYPYQC